MAVDANIIIYERIREELRAGKSARGAVEAGFGRAFWTVFDAHVTNFVAGVVLYSYGTGPDPRLRGHAAGRHRHQPVHLGAGCRAAMFDFLVEPSPARRRCRSEDRHGDDRTSASEVLRAHQAGPRTSSSSGGRTCCSASRSFLVLARDRDAADQPLRGAATRSTTAIDFRGGTEIAVAVLQAGRGPARSATAMQTGGFTDAEVGRSHERPDCRTCYMLRFGAVSPVSEQKAEQLEQALTPKLGADSVQQVRVLRGRRQGLPALRQDRRAAEIADGLQVAGRAATTPVQRFGRPEDNTYEVILVGLDIEVSRALDAKLGAGAVKRRSRQVESVGAKAGKRAARRRHQVAALRDRLHHGLHRRPLRLPLRPGHGRRAAPRRRSSSWARSPSPTSEFSLTTIAAILTVIGYSMNDTIVVFDRIRENASRLRDKQFDRVVNIVDQRDAVAHHPHVARRCSS